jgi:hypothetical protein
MENMFEYHTEHTKVWEYIEKFNIKNRSHMRAELIFADYKNVKVFLKVKVFSTQVNADMTYNFTNFAEVNLENVKTRLDNLCIDFAILFINKNLDKENES